MFFQRSTFLCPGLRLLWSFKAKKHPLLIPFIISLPGGKHCITDILCPLLLNVLFAGSGLISPFFFQLSTGLFYLNIKLKNACLCNGKRHFKCLFKSCINLSYTSFVALLRAFFVTFTLPADDSLRIRQLICL